MEHVDVEGLRIAYERVGDGPPVLLLHGYVGDSVTTWRPQLEALSVEFTVVAWDAPGAGRSSDPPESFGIAGYADCLAAFVTSLGLERAHVVGLSFGGTLALESHRRHPTMVSSLVLASAYAGWRGSLPGDVAEQRLAQALTLCELTPDDFVATLLPTMFSASTPREVVEDFASALSGFHPHGFRVMAHACAEDVRGALARIDKPTLLLHGENDVRAPREVAEDLHSAIQDSSLVFIPGAGHVCNLEAPDVFNREVRAFVRQAASPPP